MNHWTIVLSEAASSRRDSPFHGERCSQMPPDVFVSSCATTRPDDAAPITTRGAVGIDCWLSPACDAHSTDSRNHQPEAQLNDRCPSSSRPPRRILTSPQGEGFQHHGHARLSLQIPPEDRDPRRIDFLHKAHYYVLSCIKPNDRIDDLTVRNMLHHRTNTACCPRSSRDPVLASTRSMLIQGRLVRRELGPAGTVFPATSCVRRAAPARKIAMAERPYMACDCRDDP